MPNRMLINATTFGSVNTTDEGEPKVEESGPFHVALAEVRIDGACATRVNPDAQRTGIRIRKLLVGLVPDVDHLLLQHFRPGVDRCQRLLPLLQQPDHRPAGVDG